MAENLLTPSSIKLYGRVVNDLNFRYDSNTVVSGANNFLQSQLGVAPVPITIITQATNNVANVTTSLIGLVPGMIVTAPAGVFAANTNPVIISIGPGPPAQITVNPAPILTVPAPGASVTAALPGTQKPNFARIYAFSFEGAIYTLPRPSMFLVHGAGAGVDITAIAGQAGPNPMSTGRTNTDVSGVVAREWEFAAPGGGANSDLRYWEYEKGDFSIRLDSEAGQFEQILLAAALRAGADMADRSGASLGVRSGASLAGASLAGASVSGASLSGASLSGASLSGASLRNGR
jgi:hypothetical protein